jgi:hypothetical protein
MIEQDWLIGPDATRLALFSIRLQYQPLIKFKFLKQLIQLQLKYIQHQSIYIFPSKWQQS